MAYVVDAHDSLAPLVHLYRGMAAAQGGDVHAATGWLRKAVGSETTGLAEEVTPRISPRDPFLLEPSECDPTLAAPAPPPKTLQAPACPHT